MGRISIESSAKRTWFWLCSGIVGIDANPRHRLHIKYKFILICFLLILCKFSKNFNEIIKWDVNEGRNKEKTYESNIKICKGFTQLCDNWLYQAFILFKEYQRISKNINEYQRSHASHYATLLRWKFFIYFQNINIFWINATNWKPNNWIPWHAVCIGTKIWWELSDNNR